MSKHRRKGGKLPPVERQSPDEAMPAIRSRARRYRTRTHQPRSIERDNQTLGCILNFLVSLTFIVADITLINAFSPRFDRPHVFVIPGLVLLFVGGLVLCEYRLLLGRRLNNVEHSNRFRLYISQFEFHSAHFSISYFLMQIYLWILGIHFIALTYTVRSMEGWLDPLIALYSSVAVGIAIGVHALTVVLRYIVSQRLDNQFPTEIAQYMIGDDGEIEYIIGEDDYLLNVDGEVEKARGSE